MASGTVTLSTQSVDYGGGRGAVVLANNIGWSTSGDTISFSNQGSSDTASGSWILCGENNYHLILEPQVSYDGGNTWVALAHLTKAISTCNTSSSNYTNAVASSNELINQLGSYHLNGNCKLRFLYCTNSAPAPTAALPHAFPDSGYSAATQVPVDVEVSYRPGERKVSGAWRSHNRSGGKCERKTNGSWYEMKTTNGGVGTGDEPTRKQNGTWYNQRKSGAE